MSSSRKKSSLSSVGPAPFTVDPLATVIISQSLMAGQMSSLTKGVTKLSKQKAKLDVDQESLDGLTRTSDDGKGNSPSNLKKI